MKIVKNIPIILLSFICGFEVILAVEAHKKFEFLLATNKNIHPETSFTLENIQVIRDQSRFNIDSFMSVYKNIDSLPILPSETKHVIRKNNVIEPRKIAPKLDYSQIHIDTIDFKKVKIKITKTD